MFRKKQTAEDRKLKEEIRRLRDEIAHLRQTKQPRSQIWEGCRQGRHFETPQGLRHKKTLIEKDTGEITKIDFGTDNILLALSAGAKAVGSVQLFNPAIGDSSQSFVPLENCWQQTAAIEKEESRLFAVAGLNNTPFIYDRENLQHSVGDGGEQTTANTTLVGHNSAVYDVKFKDRRNLVSAGDQTIRLWDIDRSQCTKSFMGHTGDVFCVDVNPADGGQTFVSGAGDFTARVWDNRTHESDPMRAQAMLTFDTKSRDVNGVCYFPDGNAFATALNNSCVYLYDIRASTRILSFRHQSTFFKSGVEEVKFSNSGRLLFVRYGNKSVLVYDIAGETHDTTDKEAINENILPNAISASQNFHYESIAVSPGGSVFGLGVKMGNRADTVAHLYWPSGKARKR